MGGTATVVVATHDRAHQLPDLVAGLERQEIPGIDLDVVIVDDASTDDTTAVLDGLAATSTVPIRVLRLDRNQGPAVARNLGWRTGTGEVVCFTDDDCVPHPAWVRSLVAALADVEVAQGRTIPAPDQLDHQGPFAHTMDVAFEDGHYPTCNMAYRRAALEGAGGFDERFRVPYGEDTDLAWRCIEAGARTRFVPEAVVEHEVRPSSLRAHLRDVRRREGMVLTIAKHPGFRRLLPYRGFVRPAHVPLLALGVSVAAALVLRPAVLGLGLVAGAAGWYAWTVRRLRPGPPRKIDWIPTVPLAAVADAYEVAVLTRASVRYRTLVL